MFVTVIALKYALLVIRERSYGHFLKLTDSILFELPHYLTQRIMSCYTYKMAMTIDSVTSLHPMYSSSSGSRSSHSLRSFGGHRGAVCLCRSRVTAEFIVNSSAY